MKYKVFFHQGTELGLKTKVTEAKRGWTVPDFISKAPEDSQSQTTT